MQTTHGSVLPLPGMPLCYLLTISLAISMFYQGYEAVSVLSPISVLVSGFRPIEVGADAASTSYLQAPLHQDNTTREIQLSM